MGHSMALPQSRWLTRTAWTPPAIWECGMAERVSTSLLGTRVGLQPVAHQMLAVADRPSSWAV